MSQYLEGKKTMVWSFMGNARMYEALNKYGDRLDTVGIFTEQAKIVKRIYREYLEGASLVQIARGLEADELLTAAKRSKWRPKPIKKILQNEKYIGDALLQKTYTVDFLTKKRVVNNGHVPQYYVENNHEAIIPREIYL